MIQVDNLSMSYQGHTLFKQASFSVQPGDRLGLVGRNGSGKSTLFRLLTGEEPPDEGTTSIRKNYSLGTLNQHIRFSKPTVLEEAALGLRSGEEDFLYKAETILFGLGFKEDDLNRLISDFSGGYQLRLHLAKVLIAEPDCLLLDEPTNYLDIVSIRWFAHFLQKWKGEFILISHDREFMDSVTTHTMGIHRQKIKKVVGDTVAFYDQILQEEEIHEKTRINLDKKRAHAQSFIDRFGAKASKAAQAQGRQKMIGRMPTLERLKELDQLDFVFRVADFLGKKMVEMQDVSFSYGLQPLIQNFSILVEKGDRIAIVGKNGRGKSTLLRLLAKDLVSQNGITKHAENLAIGYFGQTNIDRLHPQHTVEEEISVANSKLNKTEVRSICGLMMFSGGQASKKTSMLSGGEKSRVLLGKIIAQPCNLLLLDEPTHHLDMESIEALIDALEDFDGAIVIVTHSELILKRLQLDKIIICHKSGQELHLGDYESFLEKDGWHDADEKTPSKKNKAPPPKKPASKSVQILEREIVQREKQIAILESENLALNQALILALQRSESGQEFLQSIAKNQSQMDLLHKEIEGLYQGL